MPPKPLILAFDTSAAHCAAALLQGDRVLAEALEPMEKGQAERLMPLLAEVLAQGGVTLQDLTALAVGVGPGNFTGVRISVAAARGLALGLGIPAHGVNRFDALSYGLPQPLLVAEDARRGDVYLQGYGVAGFETARLCPLTEVPAGLPIVGSAAPLIAGASVLAPAFTLCVAMARVAADRTGDASRPAPYYLRAADAAPPADPPPVIL